MSSKAISRLTLVTILGLCILPVGLAHWAWHWARPSGGDTYGQLLAQPMLAPSAAQTWQLLAHIESQCPTASGVANADLAQLLQSARQLRLAQGRDQQRIAVGACLPLGRVMPSGLYLIDPHGNAVLRYTRAQLQDAAGRQAVLREIGKVLKNNQGLG